MTMQTAKRSVSGGVRNADKELATKTKVTTKTKVPTQTRIEAQAQLVENDGAS